ncbi:MAG: hypothetical protein ACREJ3_02275, partial [Polyangiaceae bacterium]
HVARMAPRSNEPSGESTARESDGGWRFLGEISASESGDHAFSIRVVPHNAALSRPHETALIRWA